MNIRLSFLIVLILSVQIFSQDLSKVYVLTEGGFSAGSSTLSMMNMQNGNFTQSIFNPGNLGLYPDGLIYFDNHLYITEQGGFGGSGKIYKTDTLGTVINSAIVGTNPFSLAISNNKVYVTNGPAGNVSVLNLSDFSLIKNITVGVYPQEIIAHDGKVYVCNTSLWGGGSDSTVSVIDAVTDETIQTITVRKDPSALAVTNDNHLLIGCPGDETNGIIFKVNLTNYAKVDSFLIPGYGFGKDISVDKMSSKIFFMSSLNEIVELDLTAKSVSAAVSDPAILFTYGYGYDYLNQTHFVLDARDFMNNGMLRVYNNSGNLVNTYETGTSPRRVVFKYNDETTSVDESLILNKFKLEQNYPNPFNPTTKIKYSILTPPKPSPYQGEGNREGLFVSISVYDMLGNQVSILLSEWQNPGTYEIEFDASSLPSGVYFYTLSVNDFVQTRKMMLLK